MLKKIFQPIMGTLTLILLALNCMIFFIPIFLVALIKLLPNQRIKNTSTTLLEAISSLWIWVHLAFIKMTQNIQWEIVGIENLNSNNSYMVVSNHQCWLDIVVLQKAFNYKIPMLKFFIKEELKWVPLLGFAWWALDCPFMKRYSRQYLEKYPHKKGHDIETTRKACEKFKNRAVSIMSFLEGTRYNIEKHKRQKSPYQFLLKPKAGGMAYVLSSIGDKINSILDVTILYPNQKASLWDYVCGRIQRIKVITRQLPVPEQFTNTQYFHSQETKDAFRHWLNTIWQEKDALIVKEKFS